MEDYHIYLVSLLCHCFIPNSMLVLNDSFSVLVKMRFVMKNKEKRVLMENICHDPVQSKKLEEGLEKWFRRTSILALVVLEKLAVRSECYSPF